MSDVVITAYLCGPMTADPDTKTLAQMFAELLAYVEEHDCAIYSLYVDAYRREDDPRPNLDRFVQDLLSDQTSDLILIGSPEQISRGSIFQDSLKWIASVQEFALVWLDGSRYWN